MNTETQSQPLTVPVLQTWDMAFTCHIAALRLASRSQSLAIQHARVFSAWYEAQFNELFDPYALTHYALLQYRHHTLEEAGLAPATWNSRHWLLGILCDWIGRPELMRGIELKDEIQQSELHRSFTDAEYHRIHETLEKRIGDRNVMTVFEIRDRVRDRAAVTLMLECGLRVDEVHQLNKSDITLKDKSGTVIVRHGKGDKARKVPLNLLARNALILWMELRSDENPVLFDGKQTDRLSTRSIQRIITDLRADTRIPDLLCHSLRFDFAKRNERRFTAQGMTRTEVLLSLARLLGHKSTSTTEIYLRSSFAELQSAMEGVE